MALSVRFHPEAAEEAQASVDWYRARSAEAAAGFIAELDYAIERIAELPETWPSYIANTRSLCFGFIRSVLYTGLRRTRSRSSPLRMPNVSQATGRRAWTSLRVVE